MCATKKLLLVLLVVLLESLALTNVLAATGCAQPKNSARQPPHIVFMLIDDLGFNDVGFHGSTQTLTPNIDRLANEGIILDNYYAQPLCTPSRAALMTGRYPLHNGMQHVVLVANEPWGLDPTEQILPQYLKPYNYTNYMLGKWNLGAYLRKYVPTSRGFDHYFGYYSEHSDYYRRFLVTSQSKTTVPSNISGYDFRNGTDPSVIWSTQGAYMTDLITNQTVNYISAHDASKPMFLYVAHNAIHSGNADDPLQATPERLARFPNITHVGRKKVLAMTAAVDDSVGAIFGALKARGFDRNTIFIFSSDNGGPTNGFNLNYANNWPLKGGKHTLWEGGVRMAAFIWSPLLRVSGYRSRHLMHIADWLPTLVGRAAAASSKSSSSPTTVEPIFPELDGIDMWRALSHNTARSPRHEILLQYDQVYNWGGLRYHQWKLLVGEGGQTRTNGPGHYAPESDPNPRTTIQCNKTDTPALTANNTCDALVTPCLYDIENDPCEYRNVAHDQPEILAKMLKRYNWLIQRAVVPRNRPEDACSDPTKYSNLWTTWLEYSGGEAAESQLNTFATDADRRAYYTANYTTPPCNRTINFAILSEKSDRQD